MTMEDVDKAGNTGSDNIKAICPVCLQEACTYRDEGMLKIEIHNYRDSELSCPGGGDKLKW